MTKRNRRQFISQSMAAAAAVAAGSTNELLAGARGQSSSPNERLGVAVVGARGRGGSHIGVLAGRRDARILYICDVDREVGNRRVEEAAKRQGGARPEYAEDLRQVLDDPRVDVVTIATPNHWHALGAIWSMRAGKDVYLECPVSHNVAEGRLIALAARRYRRF
jgi:predicted dehydrogenase